LIKPKYSSKDFSELSLVSFSNSTKDFSFPFSALFSFFVSTTPSWKLPSELIGAAASFKSLSTFPLFS
jgi:hypothetical protein